MVTGPEVLEILAKWMGLWIQKSRVRFWSTLQYNLEAVWLALTHCQFSKRKEKHTLSVIDWPLHYWSYWSTLGSSWKKRTLNVLQETWKLFLTTFYNKLQEPFMLWWRSYQILTLKLDTIVQTLLLPYMLYFHLSLQMFQWITAAIFHKTFLLSKNIKNCRVAKDFCILTHQPSPIDCFV